jgi:uncharacterized damage-inducible protein DinB
MKTGSFADAVRSTLIAEMEELRNEVRKLAEGLTDEQIWRRPLEHSNSIGHLMLHLSGNLNHFVGAQLGNTGYIREREREFTESNFPPRAQLFEQLDNAVATFHRVVGQLTEEQLLGPHPTERFGTVLKALVYIVAHFALHRGQMSYIARLVGTKQ